MVQEVIKSTKILLILWIITAIIYPVIILLTGQIVFPYQANGSLIKNSNSSIIGSSLIGQTFKSDKYFWSRPSVVQYSEDPKFKATGISGGSNLAPSNPDLIKRIKEESDRLKTTGIVDVKADLIYTSGSGLDPHISIAAAKSQIDRIAKARNLDKNRLEIMITKYTDYPFLSIFGEPGVNLVKLNQALDQTN